MADTEEYKIIYSQVHSDGEYELSENTYEAIFRLNGMVNDHIKDGWKVSGGVTSTNKFIMQAMIRNPIKQILHG